MGCLGVRYSLRLIGHLGEVFDTTVLVEKVQGMAEQSNGALFNRDWSKLPQHPGQRAHGSRVNQPHHHV